MSRGREGVLRSRRQQITHTREETSEDDGQGPFSDVRQEAKRASISKGMQQFEKDRQEHHVVKERLNMEDLLGLVGQCAGSAGSVTPTSAPGVACGAEDADDTLSISSDDNDAAESGAASRLQSLFGGCLPARTQIAAQSPAAKPRGQSPRHAQGRDASATPVPLKISRASGRAWAKR